MTVASSSAARALLALASLLLAAGPAVAVERRAAPEPGTFWLLTRTAFVFGDQAEVDGLLLEGVPRSAPGFTVGGQVRTRYFDVGAFVEHMGSGRFARLESHARFGGMVRIAGFARWRYIEEAWGGLFVRLSPGLGLFAHDDVLLFEVARIRDVPPSTLDDLTAGFTMGFDLGMHFYLTRRLTLTTAFGFVTGVTELGGEGESMDYTRTRGQLVAGFEWRL